MKVVNKKNKTKRFIPLIILLVAILIVCLIFLIYIYTQNYITVENIDKSSGKVNSEDVTSVSPIIINNVVVGGVSDKGKWLSKDNLFGKANIVKGAELDMYNITGKMGTFEIYSVTKDDKKDITYAVPLKDIMDEEYIGVAKSEANVMTRALTRITPTEKDEIYVKKALGKYRLLNNTVKVNEVYEAYLGTDQKTRIISATSTGDNKLGVYSVVVFVKGSRAEIIKYSYVKNTESSINWPVYSIKFVCDLNNDDNYEIVLQEARELTMKYSIMEYNKNKYYEVIGLEFNIK